MSTPMPPERATHAILHLIGQVHALFMVSQTLVRCHPDPEKLLSEINGLSQQALAQLEQLPLSGDVVIEGFQHVMDTIRRIAEDAVKVQCHTSTLHKAPPLR